MKQMPLPLPHDAAMGADDFLVTDSNREAVAWIDKFPDWAAQGLVLTGLPSSGKTHALNLWLAKSGGKAIGVADLVVQNAEALTLDTQAIAIDDADALAGNAEAEESLFHLYNHLKAAKGFLVLTMTDGVGQTGFVLPDLRSRLLTLPAVRLGAPDDALLQALIVKQFRDRQIAVDGGVVTYLSSRASRDAASISALIERLDKAALAQGRKITTALARAVLEDKDV